MSTVDHTTPLVFRCPYCFARGIDSAELHWEQDIYFCSRCVFSGERSDVLKAYEAYQERYKLMRRRLPILTTNFNSSK